MPANAFSSAGQLLTPNLLAIRPVQQCCARNACGRGAPLRRRSPLPPELGQTLARASACDLWREHSWRLLHMRAHGH